jgi:class III poly(R)-hydroxyalkanoic acid synthase PhaE subunit
MAAPGNNDSKGFEEGMRRHWEAWTQAMQGQGAAATADFPWRESIEQWTRLVTTDTPAEVQELGARFQHQAGDWLAAMQQVAARFAGRDTSAAEVAGAWRDTVQGQGDDLLRWMLEAARGGNALNDQPWVREFARAAQTGFGGEWLNSPLFGPAREHQARWQALLKIQQDYQARAEAYIDLIRTVLDDAFKRFEAKLAEHESSGSQLTSARAMFDLWIDAAEDAYAKMALSEEFQRIYGELANAQMRLRAASQSELERACEAMGVPTRSEMDTAHRRITELERQLRRLLEATARTTEASASAAPASRSRSTSAAKAEPHAPKASKKAAAKAAPAKVKSPRAKPREKVGTTRKQPPARGEGKV